MLTNTYMHLYYYLS